MSEETIAIFLTQKEINLIHSLIFNQLADDNHILLKYKKKNLKTNYEERERRILQLSEIREKIKTDNLVVYKEPGRKPVINRKSINEDYEKADCPSCKSSLVSRVKNPTRFCGECGQALKW